MKKFIIGLTLGIAFSSIATFAQSFMTGWTVTIRTNEGVEVTCEDPIMWGSIKEIECDGGEIE